MIKFVPLSGREVPRFAGVKTFFRLPHVSVRAEYDIGILGVPYDGGTSYRPGARFAPSSLRSTSSLGRGFHWSRSQMLWEKSKIADIGDCPVVPIDQLKTQKSIEAHFTKILNLDKKLVAVGGDHSITLPILRAVAKKFGRVSLIHFDAHLDTYPAAWDCEYHHGSFLRHAVEEGLVNSSQSLQIGLRGPLAGREDLDFVRKHKIRFTTVDDVRKNGLDNFIKTLPKFKMPTYISFDIDCLDPAYAPGTGTPVPGGLTTYETQRILRGLHISQLVGADVVEVCPAYDQSEITNLAAVDTLFEILFLFQNRVQVKKKQR